MPVRENRTIDERERKWEFDKIQEELMQKIVDKNDPYQLPDLDITFRKQALIELNKKEQDLNQKGKKFTEYQDMMGKWNLKLDGL